MKCPKCKNPNEANSQLCEWCGAELIENTNNINSTNSTTDTTTIGYKPEIEYKIKTNLPIASIVISLGIIFLSFYMLTELQKSPDIENFNFDAEWVQKDFESSSGRYIDLNGWWWSVAYGVNLYTYGIDYNLVIPIIVLVSLHFFVSVYFLVCTLQGKKSKMIILITSLVITLGVVLLTFISLIETNNLPTSEYLPHADIKEIQNSYYSPDGGNLNLIKVQQQYVEKRYFIYDFRALINILMILSSLLFFVSINFLVSTIRNKKSIN